MVDQTADLGELDHGTSLAVVTARAAVAAFTFGGSPSGRAALTALLAGSARSGRATRDAHAHPKPRTAGHSVIPRKVNRPRPLTGEDSERVDNELRRPDPIRIHEMVGTRRPAIEGRSQSLIALANCPANRESSKNGALHS